MIDSEVATSSLKEGLQPKPSRKQINWDKYSIDARLGSTQTQLGVVSPGQQQGFTAGSLGADGEAAAEQALSVGPSSFLSHPHPNLTSHLSLIH